MTCVLALLAACTANTSSPDSSSADASNGSAVSSADPAQADAVMKIVRDTMAESHLKAVIVRVTVDGKEIVTQASASR